SRMSPGWRRRVVCMARSQAGLGETRHSLGSQIHTRASTSCRGYRCRVRNGLTVDDLGGFLDQPRVAVLATLRRDRSVLHSPGWHEWRDGGFSIWVEHHNVKTRHLKRDPRVSLVVAESEIPLRGVEVRGAARWVEDDVTETARRIAARYLGE